MRRRVVELVGPRARTHVGLDLPLGLPAHPAHPRRPARLPLGFTVYDDADSAPPGRLIMSELGPRHKRLSPRSRATAAIIGQAKTECSSTRGLHEASGTVPDPFRRRIADDLHALPAAPAGGQRHGLRRPACSTPSNLLRRDPTCARATRSASATSSSTSSRTPTAPRTRSCKHARRRAPQRRAWWATRTSRSTGSAARTSATSCEFEQAFPRRHHDRARAELPLDPDDPRRGERRHRQQRRVAAQGALHRGRRGRADPSVPGRGRARRGRGSRANCALRTEASLNWGDVAVFYRTNAQSRVLEEEMLRATSPTKCLGQALL